MNKAKSLVVGLLSLGAVATSSAQQAIKNRTSDTVMKHLALANGNNPSQITGPNSINSGQSDNASATLVRTPSGIFLSAPQTSSNIPTTIPNETIGSTTLTFNNALQHTRQTSGEILLEFQQKDARVDANNNGLPDGHFTNRELPTLQTNGNTIPNNTRVRLNTPTLKDLATGGTILASKFDRLRWDEGQNKRIDETIGQGGLSEQNNRIDRVQYLGIDDIATMGSASIYPNPATDIITISTPDSNTDKKIEIYNISGQIVQSQVIGNDNNTLDISFLPAGIYIVTTQDEDNNKTMNKVIKK